MSWPETTALQLLEELAKVEQMIANLKPGAWCDEECAKSLYIVADDARKARVIVQKKAGLPSDRVDF